MKHIENFIKIIPKYRVKKEDKKLTKRNNKKKTTEQYKQELHNINPNIEVLEEYINSNTKILHLCKICNNKWYIKPGHALSGHGCKKCSDKANGLSKRKDLKILISEIRSIEGLNNIDIIGEYINNNTPLLCRCNICNYEWYPYPCSLLKGYGCPTCAGRITEEYFNKMLKEKHPEIELVKKYKTYNSHVEVKCKNCKYIWNPIAKNLLNGNGCPYCTGRIKITKDNFTNLFKANGNHNVEIIGSYINSTTNIKCRCKICDNIWMGYPYLLVKGAGCKRCADKNHGLKLRMTHEEYVKKVYEINNNIEIISKYITAKDNVSCKCIICNYQWTPIAYSLLQGNGCPKCSFSKGEKIIELFLEENNLTYSPQKTFDDLLGIGNGLLSYDFYLPQYNLLIEFQGEQHEHPVEYFGGEKRFKIQQEHDKRKREYAEKNNINLLEIWYYDIDNIESILLQTVNEIKENNLKLESVETVIPA